HAVLAAEVAPIGHRNPQISDQPPMPVAKWLTLHIAKATLRAMRRAAGIVVVGLACLLGGCGSTGQDQVRAKVRQLVSAVWSQNYTMNCKEVLAPSLVAQLQASGTSCDYVMQLTFGGGQPRTISVRKILISGRSAQATTFEATRGQQASVQAIGLVQTSSG